MSQMKEGMIFFSRPAGCLAGPQLCGMRGQEITIFSSLNWHTIATSHDLTPNGGFTKGHPLISGKPRLVKYYNLARLLYLYMDLSHLRQIYFLLGALADMLIFGNLGFLVPPCIYSRIMHRLRISPRASCWRRMAGALQRRLECLGPQGMGRRRKRRLAQNRAQTSPSASGKLGKSRTYVDIFRYIW